MRSAIVGASALATGTVFALVVAGTADPKEPAADLGPIARLTENVDYRVNPLGQGDPPRAASPRSSISQPPFLVCRMRFFAFANSMHSRVVISDRSPRSIWSWRTQLWIAAVLTPSLTAAVVIGLPARTSATTRIRNSAGKGLGMSEASQREPDTHIISGNQTMGHVKKSTKPVAVPTDS